MVGPEREDPCRDLRSLVDAMDDPVFVVEPDYRVHLVNRRARELYPQAADGTMCCHQLSHRSAVPCTGEDHPCPMLAAREHGLAAKVLHKHFDREGRARYFEITASPLRGPGGSFEGIVETQREVTARILAEQKLAHYAEELQQSNGLKDLFIDIMRHDLMSPVQGILTTALCALREEHPPGVREDFQEVATQTRKIVDLIQNASVLSKLESGAELPFSDADLVALAEAAAAEQRGPAAERGMRIETLGRRPATARVNPLVGDVFANLISNAVKYGAEGTTITVSVAPANGNWRIAVADRGAGVPDRDKQAIFTRFTRRAREGVKGIGLGLSIVRKIVEAHAGKVWVEDNPGGGSVFVIELPRAAA